MSKVVALIFHLFLFFLTIQQITFAAAPSFSGSAQSQIKIKETRAIVHPIAFINANLIPMDREVVIPNQTVIVRGDRIEAIGPTAKVRIPAGTMMINAKGRYLVPGLVDTHVHLGAEVGGRPNFGDAPLFLSYGITTVFNLKGTPDHLSWKEKIQQGYWLTPNLYTAGDYINEPRFITPEEVEKEITKQAQAGYDIIKYHELGIGNDISTKIGLQKTAYARMTETAARLEKPLIGHAPHNLGFNALIEAHQSLAHVSELVYLYFFPEKLYKKRAMVSSPSYLVILVTLIFLAIIKFNAKIRKHMAPIDPNYLREILWLTIVLVVLGFLTFFYFTRSINTFLISDNRWPVFLFTTLSIFFTFASFRIIILTRRLLQKPPYFEFIKICHLILAISTIAFSFSLLISGNIAWRHSTFGLKQMSQQCREADIWVQSTLVAGKALARMNNHEKPQMLQDPDLRYVPFPLKKRWEYWDELPYSSYNAYFYKICQETINALHLAGSPIMAGTDANGGPFIIPGSSLHREFQLLLECGLTPYEVLKTATVNPALFLKKQDEFGTIALGKRADLLLLDVNPLVDMGCMKQPLGVMVRGKWLERKQLNKMLAKLL